MKLQKTLLWISAGIAILLVVVLFRLQHGTNSRPVMGQAALLPTPQDVIPLSEQGYTTPTPDAHEQMHATLLSSTDPGTTHMGDMTPDASLAERTPAGRKHLDVRTEKEYYTNERGGASVIERYFITDPHTGQEIRLGDDQGETVLTGASNDDYILWKYICDCPDEGVYVYTFADYQNRLFKPQVDLRVITNKGAWVVYIKPGDANENDTLMAYNVETMELLTMDEDASLYLCFAYCEDDNIPPHADWVTPLQQLAFNGTAFFWISHDQQIEQYNLTTRTHSAYPMPAYAWERPTGISTSDKTVVWRSRAGYWGYDLINRQLFAIRSNPPGWEDIGSNRFVLVTKDDQLRIYLSFDDQAFSFTAPIIRP